MTVQNIPNCRISTTTSKKKTKNKKKIQSNLDEGVAAAPFSFDNRHAIVSKAPVAQHAQIETPANMKIIPQLLRFSSNQNVCCLHYCYCCLLLRSCGAFSFSAHFAIGMQFDSFYLPLFLLSPLRCCILCFRDSRALCQRIASSPS